MRKQSLEGNIYQHKLTNIKYIYVGKVLFEKQNIIKKAFIKLDSKKKVYFNVKGLKLFKENQKHLIPNNYIFKIEELSLIPLYYNYIIDKEDLFKRLDLYFNKDLQRIDFRAFNPFWAMNYIQNVFKPDYYEIDSDVTYYHICDEFSKDENKSSYYFYLTGEVYSLIHREIN